MIFYVFLYLVVVFLVYVIFCFIFIFNKIDEKFDLVEENVNENWGNFYNI